MAAGPGGDGADRVDGVSAKGDIHPRDSRLSKSKDTDRDRKEDKNKDRDRDRGRDRDRDRYKHHDRDQGRDRDSDRYKDQEPRGRHHRERKEYRDQGRDRDCDRYRDQEPRGRHHLERKEYRDHPDGHDHHRGRDSERRSDRRRGGHWRHRSHSRSHSRGRGRRSGSRSRSKRRRESERDGHHGYRSRSRSRSRGRSQRSRSHSHSRQRDLERDWNRRHRSGSHSRDRNHRSSPGSHSKSQYAANVTSFQEEAQKVQNIHSPRQSPIRSRKMKLLILDLNGLLADINRDHHNTQLSHAKVRGQLVFKRPYCDDFLRFCFHNFHIGIWSSRLKKNVDSVVDILMKDLKQHLLFCWDLSKCTATGFNTLENKRKPLVLKELKKLWNIEEPDLPWKEGWFSPSNTLLVDDSPYKALRNPPYTAIFPFPYSYKNEKDDSLSPGGDLRLYLENLASANDVQHYVKEHPFGQPSITEKDPHWDFYVQMLEGRT